MTDKILLWEILVPASKTKQRFSYEHHKLWDEFVINLAGGVTVFKAAKGSWLAPIGELHEDRMIPCRVACTRSQLQQILDFTGKLYQQLAVMAYLVSQEVIIHPTTHLLDTQKDCGTCQCGTRCSTNQP